MKPRLHTVALPHTQTRKEYLACAYTQKVRNFCRMMVGEGYEVIHYGAEGSDVPCEHVTVITQDEQRRTLPDYDGWREGRHFGIEWRTYTPYWEIFNYRAAVEINRRKKPSDILCLIAGNTHRPIANMVHDLKVCEFGIGYNGVFAPFKVFESYAWMHSVYSEGSLNSYNANGQYYDTVIPNYYDPQDFTLGQGDGGYLLFVGRLIQRKGLDVAVQTAKAANMPLIIAGQGGTIANGQLQYDGVALPYEGIDYIGLVDAEKRNELMGAATALLVPTVYIGPFEGVHAEAQLCGTPVITTDWGVFTETVTDGFNGYRCHTLREYVDAVKAAPGLDRAAIREHAMSKWAMPVVAKQYDRYFQRLADLDKGGWGYLGD